MFVTSPAGTGVTQQDSRPERASRNKPCCLQSHRKKSNAPSPVGHICQWHWGPFLGDLTCFLSQGTAGYVAETHCSSCQTVDFSQVRIVTRLLPIFSLELRKKGPKRLSKSLLLSHCWKLRGVLVSVSSTRFVEYEASCSSLAHLVHS